MSELKAPVDASENQGQTGAVHTAQDAAAMRNFMILYGGQILSFLGTSLSGFAVGVWIFQKTGSVMDFALIGLFTLAPVVLISPVAGIIADRWDKKTMLIITDGISALFSVWVFWLAWTNQLEFWHLYTMAIVSGLANGLQRPIYESTLPRIVPKRLLGNANGMIQTGIGIAELVTPLLAGILVAQFGLLLVLSIDLITFVIAAIGVLVAKVPKRQPDATPPSWWADMRSGWLYVMARRGLLALFLFMMVRNFFVGIIQAVGLPILLTITTPEISGLLLSIGGLGVIVGGLFVSITGGMKRRIWGVILAQVVTGIALIFAGATSHLWLIGVAILFVFAAIPIEQSNSMVVVQTKVEPSILGRVQSVDQLLSTLAIPLAFLVAGPLADGLFEPMLAVDGLLASSVGQIIGVGPGRGMALMLIIFGLITIGVAIMAYRYRPLREIESELPDMLSEDEVLAMLNPAQEVSHAAA